MEKATPQIIVVMGPTASGKSDAAIRLAKKFGGEIISADSRQIYRGMDTGTGKVINDFSGISNNQFLFPKHEEGFFSEGIEHYLIDVTDPMEDFNVSHFKKLAEDAIKKILAQKKIPIICGGTGFWIDTLISDAQLPEVAPNELLRSKLHNQSAAELFSLLQAEDPQRASTIDPHNKVRLIRALEIVEALGKVPDQSSVAGHKQPRYDLLQIALDVPRETLNENIKKRLDQRFEEGMIEEVRQLHASGISYEWMEKIGLEYRWIARFLQGKVAEREMREKLYYDIIHYAKRQMTWLKKNPRVIWTHSTQELLECANTFLNKKKA